jgi:hypothetical protein
LSLLILVVRSIVCTQADLSFATLYLLHERIFMTQAQLNRAVARVTGESVGMVEQLGFNLMVVPVMQRTPQSFHRTGKKNRSRWTERRQSRRRHRRAFAQGS